MDQSIKQFSRNNEGAIYILRADGTIWYGVHFGSCGSECQLLQLNITYVDESATISSETERTYEHEDIPF